MSEKISHLKLAKPELETGDSEICRFLEEALAEAKTGILGAVAICKVSKNGDIFTGFKTDGGPRAHQLVAGALYLLTQAEKASRPD